MVKQVNVILFSGSRTLSKDQVYHVLSQYKFGLLLVGDCKIGGDLYALQYVKEKMIDYRKFNALWDYYGKSAGVIRNEEMVLDALKHYKGQLLGIGLIVNDSPGTTHCLTMMEKYHLPYEIWNFTTKKHLIHTGLI